MKRKTKSSKAVKSVKSVKGTAGAPPKPIKFPVTPFTINRLKNQNRNQCKLSVITKVMARVESGEIIQLKSVKQPGGRVGRPADSYILKEYFNKNVHTLKGATVVVTKKVTARKAKVVVKKVKKNTRTVAVVNGTVAPTTPPVTESVVQTAIIETLPPVIETQVAASPVVPAEPIVETAPVSSEVPVVA